MNHLINPYSLSKKMFVENSSCLCVIILTTSMLASLWDFISCKINTDLDTVKLGRFDRTWSQGKMSQDKQFDCLFGCLFVCLGLFSITVVRKLLSRLRRAGFWIEKRGEIKVVSKREKLLMVMFSLTPMIS